MTKDLELTPDVIQGCVNDLDLPAILKQFAEWKQVWQIDDGIVRIPNGDDIRAGVRRNLEYMQKNGLSVMRSGRFFYYRDSQKVFIILEASTVNMTLYEEGPYFWPESRMNTQP